MIIMIILSCPIAHFNYLTLSSYLGLDEASEAGLTTSVDAFISEALSSFSFSCLSLVRSWSNFKASSLNLSCSASNLRLSNWTWLWRRRFSSSNKSRRMSVLEPAVDRIGKFDSYSAEYFRPTVPRKKNCPDQTHYFIERAYLGASRSSGMKNFHSCLFKQKGFTKSAEFLHSNVVKTLDLMLS